MAAAATLVRVYGGERGVRGGSRGGADTVGRPQPVAQYAGYTTPAPAIPAARVSHARREMDTDGEADGAAPAGEAFPFRLR